MTIHAQLVTAGLTILGGCIVYVFGQFMSKIFLDPLSDLRKSINEVQLNLAIHGPTIHNPTVRTPETSAKAREALLKSAGELRAKSQTILSYDKVRRLFRLPPLQDIDRAAELLNGLSTLVYGSESKSASSLSGMGSHVIPLPAQPSHPTSSCFFVRLTTSRFFVPA